MSVEVRVNAREADAPVELLERGVRATLEDGGVAEGELSLTLLEDAAIRRLNRTHLGRDRVTDVLAFALHDGDEPLLGDVYLGREQAIRQAREHGVDPEEELLRLAVHGTLHVLGHEHPEGPERTESPMFARQEELVRTVLESRRSG